MKRTEPKPDDGDDGRTDEERALDRELKGTFPASDPTSGSGGIATPRGSVRKPRHPSGGTSEEEDRGDVP